MARERLPPTNAEAWLRRAKSHLGHAKLRSPDVELEVPLFNAQQAAEVAVKAIYVARQMAHPRTHDLTVLLTRLEQLGEQIPPTVLMAGELTVYAVETRYPEEYNDILVTEDEYTAAVAIAEAVVAWADDRLRTYLAAEDAAPI